MTEIKFQHPFPLHPASFKYSDKGNLREKGLVSNFSLHPIVAGRSTQQEFEAAGHSQKRTINTGIHWLDNSPQDSSSENGDTYSGQVFPSQSKIIPHWYVHEPISQVILASGNLDN